MKKLVIAMIVVSLAVLPAFAGPGCSKAAAEKKGCSTKQQLACASSTGAKDKSKCDDIVKKIEALKKMKGADSPEMKAVIDIFESMIKCHESACSTTCATAKKSCDGSYHCPKCKGKDFMKPGKCACGANLVKK